jgi:c-di-AMP phosphodiesterase-like protein
MGGGGHLANAATQISGQTIVQVKETLLGLLKQDPVDETEETEE